VLVIHNIKSNILTISEWTIKKALKEESIKVYSSYLSDLYKIKKLHVNLQTWYYCFTHLFIANIIKLSKMVDGIDIKGLLVP
jgi:hypothetical protein